MRRILFALTALAALAWASSTAALSLADLTNQDAGAGLKEALAKGARSAVKKLGAENGFFGDARVKIPLPDSLKKAENTLRRFGLGKQADELILRMNRAAEAAAPEAEALLIDAVKNMSLQDAKGILTGGDDAATQYFRRTTTEPLTGKFLPVVQKAMEQVKVAESYDRFAGRGVKLGLIAKGDANLEDYITRKALDGLFLMIADEEKTIRADPVGQTSNLLKKVFGALVK